jgi:hypothetical protein
MKFFILIIAVFLAQGCLMEPFSEFKEINSKYEPIRIESLLCYFDSYSDNIANNPISFGSVGTFSGFEIDTIENSSNTYLRSKGKGSLIIPNVDLTKLQSLTFSCWFRSYAINSNTFLQQTTFLGSDTSKLSILNGRLNFGASSLNTSQRLPDSTFYGKWNMLTISAAKINSGDLGPGYIVYLNGLPITISNSSNVKFLNQKFCEMFFDFEGDFDEVLLYNKALSNSDIQKIYSDTKSKFKNETINSPVENGLFGYYIFDNGTFNDKIAERNGLGIGNLFSSETPTGKGKSLKFNSSSGFLKVNKSIWDNIEEFTISFWIKTSTTNYQPLFLQGPNRFDGLHTLALNGSGIYLGNTSYCFACPTPLNIFDNKWHMITISCDGVNNYKPTPRMSLYLDGIFYVSSPGSEIIFDSNYDLIIGGDGFTVSECSLDNIRFYNRALNNSEINNIFNFER